MSPLYSLPRDWPRPDTQIQTNLNFPFSSALLLPSEYTHPSTLIVPLLCPCTEEQISVKIRSKQHTVTWREMAASRDRQIENKVFGTADIIAIDSSQYLERL